MSLTLTARAFVEEFINGEKVRINTVVILGEVHTGLIQHSTAVPVPMATEMFGGIDRVVTQERPTQRVTSIPEWVGVDCVLPGPHSRARVVGTVAGRVVLTAGQALQGSAFTRVEAGRKVRRSPWPHHLDRLGTVESLTKFDGPAVVDGHLRSSIEAGRLDLGGVGAEMMDAVQRDPRLDRDAGLRAGRTLVRWAMRPAGRQPGLTFTLVGERLRTVLLEVDGVDTEDAVKFCEALALHDWLLTTVSGLLDLTAIGAVSLGMLVQRLLHLWMPPAVSVQPLQQCWTQLDEETDFTRQWHAVAARARDRLAVLAVTGR